MSAFAWGAATVAAMAAAGAGSTLIGGGQQRALAARITAIRPMVVVSTAPKTAIRQERNLAARLLDRLLGIERQTASDETMAVVPVLALSLPAGSLVFSVLALLLGLPVPLSCAVAAAGGLAAARSGAAARRMTIRIRMEDEFALALGIIIRCVRVGLPVTEAMRAVAGEVPAPTGLEFRRCVDQIQLGEDFDKALIGMARRCALADYRFFAVSVSLQRQTGGNLAETLDNLSETVRKRKVVRLKVQALTSEPKATVLVLSLLPFLVGGLLMLVRPDYVMTLFTTDAGRMMLGVAALMQAFGLVVIRTIIKKALS